jgi:site-specific DNA-adenine methylase
MFYYYGRKERIFNKYPKPKHDTIIEPFAGSAAYSMNYYERDVILVEKDEKIASLWQYLINVTPDEIMSLPMVEKGESLNSDKFSYLSDVQTEKNKIKLSKDVEKVKHWQIIHGDYTSTQDLTATWYIDPPYQGNGGQYYRFGNKGFDYESLREWILNRKGQIIVCENTEATWMDFKPLVEIQGQKKKTTEVIFYLENE